MRAGVFLRKLSELGYWSCLGRGERLDWRDHEKRGHEISHVMNITRSSGIRPHRPFHACKFGEEDTVPPE